MGRSQIKMGALLSYLTIAFNMIAGLIYTPWMISQIGQSHYGLYTLANSVITMLVMDFGIGAAVSRFISKYNAEGDLEATNRFLGVVYKLYLAIAMIVFAALVVLYFFIDGLYANLSADEMEIFKVLYVIVGLFSVISFPFVNLNGILIAHERFVELKLADVFHKVFIVVAMVLCLLMGQGVYALVLVNAIAGLLTIVLKLWVIKRKTPIKIRFKYRDKGLLKEIFSFSAWTTVGSLAQRMIFNITPSIIAAVSITGTLGVAVFGVATTIEGYVFIFSTAINGMFMPRIAKIVHDGKKQEQLVPLMNKVGRLQCMIIGLLVVGFIALGESFVTDIWNKPDYSESYICAVLLILPSFLHQPMEVANTTMIVENKVKQQAVVLLIMGGLNVALSLVLSKYYGALGASVSIFIAYMVRTVLMTVLYQKTLHLNMWSFFKETFMKLVPQLILTLAVGMVFSHFNPISNVYLKFAMDGIVLVGFYFALMWLCGFNPYEKSLIRSATDKFLRKKHKAST